MTDAQRSRTRRLFLAWLIAVALMAIGYSLDRNVDHRHWSAPELSRLSAGVAFFRSVKLSLIELAVLCAILRPWTFTERTRNRSLIALILFAPYAALQLLIGPGGMLSFEVHDFWVFTIALMLFFTAITPIQANLPQGQEPQSP